VIIGSESMHIDVLQMDMKNITLDTIGNKLTHFVIFSLSLWGSRENITNYIQAANELLKLNEYMILIDNKNNMINNINLEDH